MKTARKSLPNDIETLQAMVLGQQALQQEMLREKEQEIEQKDSQLRALKSQLDSLLEQLRLARHKQFGVSSEKQNSQQADLFFDEAETLAHEFEQAEQDDSIEVPAHRRKKSGRIRLPAHLPRVDVIHDLSDDEKICANDGQALHKIGEDVSEQLEIIPAQVRVIKHIRIKYACRVCEQSVKTAPLPKQPIPQSIATAGLLATVAVAKYQDALPLYRQEVIFKRHGIELPRATLANWMIRVGGQVITPLINLIRDHLLSQRLIHYDETRYQVLIEPGKTAPSQSYMWVGVGGPPGQRAVLFDYDPSRGSHVPVRLLDGFAGYLLTDDYPGYNAVCTSNHITRVGCWAHARRKFDEALKIQQNKTGKAQAALNIIGKLYRIERDIAAMTPAEKQPLRQAHSKPIIDDLRAWLDNSLSQVPPGRKLGQALHYLNNNWVRLTRFLDDGIIPLDNNPAENAIRPFVVGRKNWLHSNSVRGAHASAALYSIIETAKANGLEPYAYLAHIFKELPLAETLEDIEILLPWRVDRKSL